MFDTVQIIVAAIAMLAGSIVASSVGFGLGMTATPFMLLVLDPQTVVMMINAIGFVVLTLVVIQTRRFLRLRDAAPIATAGFLGAPVGVYALSSMSPGLLRVCIAAVILLLAAIAVSNLHASVSPPRFLGPPIGFLVGALTVSFGVGGPLLVLFLLSRKWQGQVMRATLAFYFIVLKATGVVGYVVAGLFTPERTSLFLFLIVPILVGFALASFLVKRASEEMFRKGVLAIIVVTSLTILVRELLWYQGGV